MHWCFNREKQNEEISFHDIFIDCNNHTKTRYSVFAQRETKEQHNGEKEIHCICPCHRTKKEMSHSPFWKKNLRVLLVFQTELGENSKEKRTRTKFREQAQKTPSQSLPHGCLRFGKVDISVRFFCMCFEDFREKPKKTRFSRYFKFGANFCNSPCKRPWGNFVLWFSAHVPEKGNVSGERPHQDFMRKKVCDSRASSQTFEVALHRDVSQPTQSQTSPPDCGGGGKWGSRKSV